MDDSHPMTIIANNTYELHKTETCSFLFKIMHGNGWGHKWNDYIRKLTINKHTVHIHVSFTKIIYVPSFENIVDPDQLASDEASDEAS